MTTHLSPFYEKLSAEIRQNTHAGDIVPNTFVRISAKTACQISVFYPKSQQTDTRRDRTPPRQALSLSEYFLAPPGLKICGSIYDANRSAHSQEDALHSAVDTFKMYLAKPAAEDKIESSEKHTANNTEISPQQITCSPYDQKNLFIRYIPCRQWNGYKQDDQYILKPQIG